MCQSVENAGIYIYIYIYIYVMYQLLYTYDSKNFFLSQFITKGIVNMCKHFPLINNVKKNSTLLITKVKQ